MHPVGPAERAQIIESHAIFPEHFMGPLGGHLPYIERIADHEVVDGVGAAEVEAEGLQGPQPPDVEHLALFGDLARFVVAVVMHVGRDEVQAEGAQHVGGDQYHHQRGDPAELGGNHFRPRDAAAGQPGGAVEQVVEHEEVPDGVDDNAQRVVADQADKAEVLQVFAVDHATAVQPDRFGQVFHRPQVHGQHVVAHHDQALEAPLFAVGDAALFQVGFAAGVLVVMKMQVAAHPGVDGGGAPQVDAEHHQVMHDLVLLEVHPVDQVVLQFVEQRGPEGGKDNDQPGGHDTLQVQHRVEGAAGNGHGEDGEADGVLVLEPAVPLPYIITDRDDGLLHFFVGGEFSTWGCCCHESAPFLDGDHSRGRWPVKLALARQPFDRGRQ